MSFKPLAESWQRHLGKEFNLPYMQELAQFLAAERDAGKIIFPPQDQWFAAFDRTSLERVKVVILGQDPYHGPGQAHGLSFSVPDGIAVPPSLRNIYKELEASLAVSPPDHGNLAHWADQGVLLLNSVLTVEAGNAGSHQAKGWEVFTDKVISLVNEHCDHVAFMLWGAYAQKKGARIDTNKHSVLKAPHPSPLSAYRGFMGCGHFQKANAYLLKMGAATIEW